MLTYLPTRFGIVALLVAVGQVALLWDLLPGLPALGTTDWRLMIAAICFAMATAAGMLARPRNANHPFDARWLRFRDRFGAMWGLRVIERVNAAATMYGWPFSLTWTGFYFHDAESSWDDVSEEVEADLRQTVDNLLRRFEPEEGS